MIAQSLALTKPIVQQIEDLVIDIPGWSPIDQLYTLFNLAYLTSDFEGDIVEVGSWCGRSAVVLAKAARMIGNTKVHCIDLFPRKNDWSQNPDGTYSFKTTIENQTYTGYQVQVVWQEPFEKDIAPLYEKYDGIFDIFTESIAKNNFQDIVQPFRGNTQSFCESISPDFKCKLAFLDADHCYEAVCQDINNINRFLVKGGWICFDDAFSYYDGVDQAINDLIINNSDFELCQQMTRKFFVARKR